MATRPHPLEQVEIRFGVAGGVLVALLVAARAAALPDDSVLGVLLVASAVLGATVNRRLALLLGLTTWALYTGFVTHRYGVLTFGRHDLVLLAAVMAATVLTSLAGARTACRAEGSGRCP